MNFPQNQNFSKFLINLFTSPKRAETLIEVLISISIIALLSSLSTNLLITGIRNVAENRAKLQTTIFVEEGIDYFINLFDSNKKKFSFDPENCWNMKPNSANCDSNNALLSGSYILTNELFGEETLKYSDKKLSLTAQSDLESANEFRLNSYDLNTDIDSDGDGTKDNDQDLYGNLNVPQDSKIKELGQTPFYREIQISMEQIPFGSINLQRALIKSRVLWVQGNSIKETVNTAIW